MKTRAMMKKKGQKLDGFKGMQIAIREARKTWKSKKATGEEGHKTRRRRRKSRRSMF